MDIKKPDTNDPTGMNQAAQMPVKPDQQLHGGKLEALMVTAMQEVATTGKPAIFQFGVLDRLGIEKEVAVVITPAQKQIPTPLQKAAHEILKR